VSAPASDQHRGVYSDAFFVVDIQAITRCDHASMDVKEWLAAPFATVTRRAKKLDRFEFASGQVLLLAI
jgi:hypothetical protein